MNPPWEIRFAKKLDTMRFSQPHTLHISLYYDSGTHFLSRPRLTLVWMTKLPSATEQKEGSGPRIDITGPWLWNKILDGNVLVSSVCPLPRQLHFNQKWPMMKSILGLILNTLKVFPSVIVNVMWSEIQDLCPMLTGAGTSCSSQMARFIS